jgi:hypothetical protein
LGPILGLRAYFLRITFIILLFLGGALQNDQNTSVCGLSHGSCPWLKKRMCKKWGLQNQTPSTHPTL